MTVLYDGEMPVHYGFIHLGPLGVDVTMQRGGQANGLVAAAQPGVLSLVTGLHTGAVPLVVEVLGAAPPLDDRWEDVVEVSLTTAVTDLRLHSFDDSVELVLPVRGSYRARYSATGMDRAHQADVRLPDEPEVDRYLLQLWPAPEAPDEVVRLGSETAASWHAAARATPAPPPPPTMDELAEQAHAEDAERDRLAREAEQRRELWVWGSRPPSDRLRELGPRAAQLARTDRDLVDAVVALQPSRQRAVAAWAARWASDAAGQSGVPWVAAALDALDRAAPLPPPFHDRGAAWARMFPGKGTLVATASHGPVEPRAIDPRAALVSAVLAAGDPDPALAALTAIDGASHGEVDRAVFIAAVRGLIAADAG